MTESIQYKTNEERAAIVKGAEARGLIMLHDDFLLTGMVDMNGEPIVQKVMQFGTSEERVDVYGPDIDAPEWLYRQRDLRVKMESEDLSMAELNELMRMGG
jgi:hypothetical protein